MTRPTPGEQIRFVVLAGEGDDGLPRIFLSWDDGESGGDFMLDPALAARLSASLANAVDAVKAAGADIDSSKVRTQFYAKDEDE